MTNPFLQPQPEEVVQASTSGAEQPVEVDSATVGKRLYEGPCQGGPMHTLVCVSRYPKGFLLADKPNNKAWIYDWTGNSFKVRDDEPMELNFEGRIRAATEFDYDVIAVP